MSKFTAFSYHLGISLAIFAVLGYLIVFQWYPDIFFATEGGWQGIRIIALVDIVLGPTLTLIVFKAGKPGLSFDLSAIAALQAVCLAAGTYVVYSERPLAMVYSEGFFHSLSADDYRDANQPIPDFKGLGGADPRWVSVKLPEDFAEQASIRRKALTDRTPLTTLADYYQPFNKNDVDASKDAYPLEDIHARDPTLLRGFLAKNGGAVEDYVFLPFGTRYLAALIGLRLADGWVGLLELPQAPGTEPG